jgi:hypothetical protein
VALADVLKGGSIGSRTTIGRRTAMLECGGFRPELGWSAEWFLWLAVGFTHGICYIPESLAVLPRNPTSPLEAGESDPPQQEDVIGRLLALVRSPACRGVLPFFVRSAAFSRFGPHLVRLVLGSEEHWNIETLLLALSPLYDWNRALADARRERPGEIKATLARLVPWVIEQCRRDGIERAVLYGCGSHTRLLLPLWLDAQGPPIVRIIATDPGETAELTGIPVTRADVYEPSPGEGIVLSSNSFEQEMADTCRTRWPSAPCYLFYSRNPGAIAALEPVFAPLPSKPSPVS